MPRFNLLICILTLITCTTTAHSAPTLNERKEKIKTMEAKVSPEAQQRKERSENVLSAEAVPINKFLPVIETEKEAKRRTKEEIAYRALALLVVAVKGEGLGACPRIAKIASISAGCLLQPVTGTNTNNHNKIIKNNSLWYNYTQNLVWKLHDHSF